MEPDQERHSVGPDLGLKCLEKLSAQIMKVTLANEELW